MTLINRLFKSNIHTFELKIDTIIKEKKKWQVRKMNDLEKAGKMKKT